MPKIKITLIPIALGLIISLSKCASIPKNASAVKNFKVEKYLGTWYEIARFDFSFEKNLNNTSAQYMLNQNGNLTVINSGYNFEKQIWKKAEGVAKFSDDKTVAQLKVSFFGPFYAGYNVIAIDNDYQYALIAGKNLDYLWILSRQKTIPESVKEEYLKIAQDIGYDISRFVWVKHDKANNPYLNEK